MFVTMFGMESERASWKSGPGGPLWVGLGWYQPVGVVNNPVAPERIRELIAEGMCPRIRIYDGADKLPPHDHQDCFATTDTVLGVLIRIDHVIVPAEALARLQSAARDNDDQRYVQESVMEAAQGAAKEVVD